MNGRLHRVAACEAPADMLPGSREWGSLTERAQRVQSGIFLLNVEIYFPSLPSVYIAVRDACMAAARILNS